MKRICGNKSAEQQIRTCNVITILLGLSILLLVSVMIYDMIKGEGIDASRSSILCADVCIFCLNIRNRRNAVEMQKNE